MATKELRITQVVNKDGIKANIPIGIAISDKPGKILTIITGIHGTEFVAHETIMKFWKELDPEKFRGEVRIVLLADEAAVLANRPATNPIDGKNLNRVWPGDSNGSITEAIAAEITENVIKGSDALIDVHGGEWNEIIDMYVITHRSGQNPLDSEITKFALALGYPYVETTDIDASFLGKGMCSAEACRTAIPSVTLEIGGQGLRDDRWITGIFKGLTNAMSYLGMNDVRLAPIDKAPIQIREGLILKSEHNGTLKHLVAPAELVLGGSSIANIYDIAGELIQQITAPEDCVIMCLPAGRGVMAGGFVAKVGALY